MSNTAPGIVLEKIKNDIVAVLARKKKCRFGYRLSVVEGSDLRVLFVRLESDNVQRFGQVNPGFH